MDLKGLEGVERAFDEFLAGEEERITCIRDARGRLIVPEGIEKERTEGKTIQLTIDGTVQFICEREIERGVREFGAKSGIAIVMDPRTGEVLAMAVYPSYDPNSPSRYPASWRRNRAITDIYEPGSTFKVFLVAGALDSGKVRLSDKIFCENGVITVQGRRIHDTHENEWLTIPEVLKVSSNIGAYKIAERMTPRLFYSYVKSFGFGRRTGIELKGEVPGLIPDEEEFLKPIRYATASFGQGVAATALQVTSAFCAAVNGGILVKPTVIKEVRSPEGEILYRTRPRYRGRVISSSTSRVLREILAGVVSEEGTGSLARINGYSIGGKTGTSQKVDPVKGGYSDKRIASFIGFFPVDEPRFVVSVVVDEPEEEVYGGKVAAPIFRRIVSKLAIYEGLPPEGGGQQVALRSDEGKEAEIGGRGPKLVRVSFGGPDESSVVMPDLKGLTMVEVVDLLDSLGLEYELKGSGLAAGQFPAPGKRVKRGRTCRVYFREE
ncbi:MAG: PASTA domain-containing protein [Deltaproteobacteria bacterium]|nr:MAG: PASTA domain-containing protein [Deltaproteobacteria bacterium]